VLYGMEFFHRPEDVLNQPGFWGSRTSAVDWCEPNYTHSYFIAEFYNTVTNFPAIILSLNSMYLTYKYGYSSRFFLVNAMVAMVGIGSSMFHGTLLWTGQIADELPMVYAVLALLYSIIEMESKDKPVYKYSGTILSSFALIFTGVYLYLPDFFIFFLVAFIGCVLVLIYNLHLIYIKNETSQRQKIFIVAATGCYIGGWAFFWVPEVLFCSTLQSFNFHALWHVTSTFGAFFMVLVSIYQRETSRGRRPQLAYNCFAGIPMIPYVHIPSEKERLKMDMEEALANESREKAEVLSLKSDISCISNLSPRRMSQSNR